MNTIFQTLVYQREKGQDTVLATIIWDDGSAPRGAGSQMLVGRNGLLAGYHRRAAPWRGGPLPSPGRCWLTVPTA